MPPSTRLQKVSTPKEKVSKNIQKSKKIPKKKEDKVTTITTTESNEPIRCPWTGTNDQHYCDTNIT
jgi:hypothetical protein